MGYCAVNNYSFCGSYDTFCDVYGEQQGSDVLNYQCAHFRYRKGFRRNGAATQ